MKLSRGARVLALALAGTMLVGPAAAGAQEIPGVPPGIIPEGLIPEGTIPEGTIPPEVEAAIGDAVAQALDAAVNLDIPGVAQNSATPGQASAAAVDVPGVVTVGKADTTTNSSRVTVVGAGGQELLTREGDANGGTYAGPLAPAGDVVDAVNDALCPAGVSNTTDTCVVVLYSRATSTSNATGTSKSNVASFKGVKVQLSGTEEGIEILPVGASSSKATFFGSPRCTDIATAFIATGSGTLALLALVGVGNAISIGGILAPCPTPAP